MSDKRTSQRISSIAARGLSNPESLTLEEIKEVCASALSQTTDYIEETDPDTSIDDWEDEVRQRWTGMDETDE